MIYEYLSIAEAACIRSVSPKTVALWIRNGLPASKIGRMWVIKREDLLAYEPKPRGRRWQK